MLPTGAKSNLINHVKQTDEDFSSFLDDYTFFLFSMNRVFTNGLHPIILINALIEKSVKYFQQNCTFYNLKNLVYKTSPYLKRKNNNKKNGTRMRYPS